MNAPPGRPQGSAVNGETGGTRCSAYSRKLDMLVISRGHGTDSVAQTVGVVFPMPKVSIIGLGCEPGKLSATGRYGLIIASGSIGLGS
jgi:hypothetical protein